MSVRSALFLTGCALLPSAAAHGQSGQPDQPGSLVLRAVRSTPARFALSPAGPRALGLGGAFVAVADDPSAADSNPAGLARLERPQLLVSLRSASFDTEFTGGLARFGAETTESVTGPAFAGYARPLGRVTLAAYYQEDARFASGARFDPLPIILGGPDSALTIPCEPPCPPPPMLDERRYDQRIETLGFAAGTRVGRAVSLGVAVRYQRLALEWLDEVSLDLVSVEDLAIFVPVAGGRAVVDDEDDDVTVSVGLLVHPEGRWSGGLSFQQGGSYGLTGVATLFVSDFPVPLPLLSYDVPVATPDVLQAGAAFRPSERWLLSAQASHLTYSDLRITPIFLLADGFLFPNPSSPVRGDEPIDDETQLHFGAQLLVGPAVRPVALRAGLWTDPDHDGSAGIDSEQAHLAFGAGTVFGRGLALDGAVRLSDAVTEALVGFSYRF